MLLEQSYKQRGGHTRDTNQYQAYQLGEVLTERKKPVAVMSDKNPWQKETVQPPY